MMWTTRKHQKDFFLRNIHRHKPVGWYLMNWKILHCIRYTRFVGSIEASQGSVYMYIFKSNQYNLGNVWCWADDISWNITRSIGHMMLVSDNLSKGKHDIHCELLNSNNTHFRIIAIFSG